MSHDPVLCSPAQAAAGGLRRFGGGYEISDDGTLGQPASGGAVPDQRAGYSRRAEKLVCVPGLPDTLWEVELRTWLDDGQYVYELYVRVSPAPPAGADRLPPEAVLEIWVDEHADLHELFRESVLVPRSDRSEPSLLRRCLGQVFSEYCAAEWDLQPNH